MVWLVDLAERQPLPVPVSREISPENRENLENAGQNPQISSSPFVLGPLLREHIFDLEDLILEKTENSVGGRVFVRGYFDRKSEEALEENRFRQRRRRNRGSSVDSSSHEENEGFSANPASARLEPTTSDISSGLKSILAKKGVRDSAKPGLSWPSNDEELRHFPERRLSAAMGVIWHQTKDFVYLSFYDDETSQPAVAAFTYEDIQGKDNKVYDEHTYLGFELVRFDASKLEGLTSLPEDMINFHYVATKVCLKGKRASKAQWKEMAEPSEGRRL